MAVLVVAMSLLMVATRIHMFSLKFKNFDFRENLRRYVIILAALLFVISEGVPGLAWTILFYLVLSLLPSRAWAPSRPMISDATTNIHYISAYGHIQDAHIHPADTCTHTRSQVRRRHIPRIPPCKAADCGFCRQQQDIWYRQDSPRLRNGGSTARQTPLYPKDIPLWWGRICALRRDWCRHHPGAGTPAQLRCHSLPHGRADKRCRMDRYLTPPLPLFITAAPS